MSESAIQEAGRTERRVETAVIWLVGTVFVLAALAELPFANAPCYGQWPWRTLPFFRTLALFALPLPLFVWAALKIEHPGRWGRPAEVLACLVLFHFSAQLMGILAEPASVGKLKAIVQSARATSYYTDAARIEDLRGWLSQFHAARLELHSATHPPGPILFYYVWQKLLGHEYGAYVGGAAIGLLGSFGIPMMYSFAGLWTDDRKTRLTASCLYALIPALILFFPEFDQLYPLFSMALPLFWIRASEGQRGYAVCFGLTLFLATFFAYNLLAIGAFIVMYVASRLWRARADGRAWFRHLLEPAAISVAVCAASFLLLYLLTGFRPLHSFLHALEAERGFAHGRRYFHCLLFGPIDFLLGAGIVTLPLLFRAIRRLVREKHSYPRELRMSLLGLLAIALIDVSGGLGSETARVWLFLQPLITVPVAIECARASPVQHRSVYAVQWITLIIMKCKLDFIIP